MREIRAGRAKQAKKDKVVFSKCVSEPVLLLRLRLVERALINGKRGGQILEALKDAGHVVSYYTVLDYLVRVRDKWAEEDRMLRPIWRERQLRKLHDVAAKLEGSASWGYWVAVQKLIADLEGNLAPVKVEHSHIDPFDGWSLTELKEFVITEGKSIPERVGPAGQENGDAGQVWPTQAEGVATLQ